MRQEARLSTAVPHSTAFLPPAFMAMLPPMQEASAEVGSTAKTRPARSAASMTRRVTAPAPTRITLTGDVRPGNVLSSTGPRPVQLLGVHDRREAVERDGAAVVAGAAAAGNDGEAQLDERLHQRRAFAFRVRRDHHERVLHAPVGGVRHVRHAREAVEGDVVLARDRRQPAQGLAAELARLLELALEFVHGPVRRDQQLLHALAALRIRGVRLAARLHFAQAMAHRLHERIVALRIVEEVVLQVGIALDDPDVAQHLVEHARRSSGAPLRAQFVQHLPGIAPEQADDDLPVGERGVVVRDLAQSGGHRMRLVARGRKGTNSNFTAMQH